MNKKLRLFNPANAVDDVILKLLEVNGPVNVQMLYKRLHKEFDKNDVIVRLMVMADLGELKILPFVNTAGLPDWIILPKDCVAKGTWVKNRVPLERPFLNDYETE